MPFYDVQHTLSLSEQQKEELANAILTIHTSLFMAPKLFVNVAFTDVSNREFFAAGKRVRCSILEMQYPHSRKTHLMALSESLPSLVDNSLCGQEHCSPCQYFIAVLISDQTLTKKK